MPNHLISETSPYLLQHAGNPVDWYPWCAEALALSAQQEKPIFLSIGYSACHWCHVMEHESFENREIAAFLNEHFICIKVDREERPDLDQIYMAAVQAMTGHGGWPMSVFLTPQLKPFFGGTYWPPQSKMGMPGFDQVLTGVADAWANRRQQAIEQSETLTNHIQELMNATSPAAESEELSLEMIRRAASSLERIFDFTDGGFGGAPKFPHSIDLQLLLRLWHREPRDGLLQMVTTSLDKMAAGGIYDHLGGGFARYCVDSRWLVPHFEKMLYDNSLLSLCYLEAYQATGNGQYAQVARETLDYVLRDMTDPQGGFYSSEDADTDGEEGKFYLWTVAEIQQVLGADAAKTFCYVYDVSPEGNFEGKNILNLPKSIAACAKLLHRDEQALTDDLSHWREQLLEARDQRERPGCDDKILVSWNALMIDAMAQGSAILDEPKYLQAAEKAAQFLCRELLQSTENQSTGKLLHTWRNGEAKYDAYLDDYTYFIKALISLYEVSFHEKWIEQAVRLADYTMQHFSDPAGGFFYTADDHETLIARNKDLQDGSIPSGNAMAAVALWKLGKLTGVKKYSDAATTILQSVAARMTQSPTAMTQMFLALDFQIGPSPEIVITSSKCSTEIKTILHNFNQYFIPNKIIAFRTEDHQTTKSLDDLFAGKEFSDDHPLIYLCENQTCQEPIHGIDTAIEVWKQLGNR